ncbi:tol-pal system-associated acyl-CoA thioesterase [Limibaculum sp. FT325]|uniref:tol-pal system-associated acyl-CoA thioesterase n=1 Tax=Thermohalobaculum sediminis TaxID=2939436 RepID=UPI0020BF2C81|nr:tol-pal system-associated acyl-CoA thioesterase [Limibaculum sediminis]MCL5778507.1 tol-pal system-associated acyl-CoA thioesterase [Limibaculum sediminis]
MHEMDIRVYYEDTDLAGVVYYANYLRFIERGRTEALRAAGIDQGRLKAEEGAVFVVRRIEADYLLPARFDDLLNVLTRVEALTGATVVMAQEVLRGPEILFRARVTIACMGTEGRPRRLPGVVRAALAGSV